MHIDEELFYLAEKEIRKAKQLIEESKSVIELLIKYANLREVCFVSTSHKYFENITFAPREPGEIRIAVQDSGISGKIAYDEYITPEQLNSKFGLTLEKGSSKIEFVSVQALSELLNKEIEIKDYDKYWNCDSKIRRSGIDALIRKIDDTINRLCERDEDFAKKYNKIKQDDSDKYNISFGTDVFISKVDGVAKDTIFISTEYGGTIPKEDGEIVIAVVPDGNEYRDRSEYDGVITESELKDWFGVDMDNMNQNISQEQLTENIGRLGIESDNYGGLLIKIVSEGSCDLDDLPYRSVVITGERSNIRKENYPNLIFVDYLYVMDWNIPYGDVVFYPLAYTGELPDNAVVVYPDDYDGILPKGAIYESQAKIFIPLLNYEPMTYWSWNNAYEYHDEYKLFQEPDPTGGHGVPRPTIDSEFINLLNSLQSKGISGTLTYEDFTLYNELKKMYNNFDKYQKQLANDEYGADVLLNSIEKVCVESFENELYNIHQLRKNGSKYFDIQQKLIQIYNENKALLDLKIGEEEIKIYLYTIQEFEKNLSNLYNNAYNSGGINYELSETLKELKLQYYSFTDKQLECISIDAEEMFETLYKHYDSVKPIDYTTDEIKELFFQEDSEKIIIKAYPPNYSGEIILKENERAIIVFNYNTSSFDLPENVLCALDEDTFFEIFNIKLSPQFFVENPSYVPNLEVSAKGLAEYEAECERPLNKVIFDIGKLIYSDNVSAEDIIKVRDAYNALSGDEKSFVPEYYLQELDDLYYSEKIAREILGNSNYSDEFIQRYSNGCANYTLDKIISSLMIMESTGSIDYNALTKLDSLLRDCYYEIDESQEKALDKKIKKYTNMEDFDEFSNCIYDIILEGEQIKKFLDAYNDFLNNKTYKFTSSDEGMASGYKYYTASDVISYYNKLPEKIKNSFNPPIDENLLCNIQENRRFYDEIKNLFGLSGDVDALHKKLEYIKKEYFGYSNETKKYDTEKIKQLLSNLSNDEELIEKVLSYFENGEVDASALDIFNNKNSSNQNMDALEMFYSFLMLDQYVTDVDKIELGYEKRSLYFLISEETENERERIIESLSKKWNIKYNPLPVTPSFADAPWEYIGSCVISFGNGILSFAEGIIDGVVMLASVGLQLWTPPEIDKNIQRFTEEFVSCDVSGGINTFFVNTVFDIDESIYNSAGVQFFGSISRSVCNLALFAIPATSASAPLINALADSGIASESLMVNGADYSEAAAMAFVMFCSSMITESFLSMEPNFLQYLAANSMATIYEDIAAFDLHYKNMYGSYAEYFIENTLESLIQQAIYSVGRYALSRGISSIKNTKPTTDIDGDFSIKHPQIDGVDASDYIRSAAGENILKRIKALEIDVNKLSDTDTMIILSKIGVGEYIKVANGDNILRNINIGQIDVNKLDDVAMSNVIFKIDPNEYVKLASNDNIAKWISNIDVDRLGDVESTKVINIIGVSKYIEEANGENIIKRINTGEIDVNKLSETTRVIIFDKMNAIGALSVDKYINNYSSVGKWQQISTTGDWVEIKSDTSPAVLAQLEKQAKSNVVILYNNLLALKAKYGDEIDVNKYWEIVNTPKELRPDPSTYIDPNGKLYQDWKNEFSSGEAYIVYNQTAFELRVEKQKNIGAYDGQFVISKSDYEKIMQVVNDKSLSEETKQIRVSEILGFEGNYFPAGMVIMKRPTTDSFGNSLIKMSTGRESTANDLYSPYLHTSGGKIEGVLPQIGNVKRHTYIDSTGRSVDGFIDSSRNIIPGVEILYGG